MPGVKREVPETAISAPSSAAHWGQDNVVADDDYVVRELDVYLSNEFAENLHLVQFPLQQAGASQMPISGARVKPRHNILQIDQDMPTLPKRIYKPQEQNFSFMNTRTFQSQTIPVETHLCVGKIREDEEGGHAMYLVPIHHISQMRPTMSHIIGDTVPNDEKGDDDAKEEDKDSSAAARKPVVFQRKESERAAMARKSSYAYKKESEIAEEWDLLEVVEEDSEQSQAMANKVFECKTQHSSPKPPPGKTMRGSYPQVDYVESLNYMPPSSSDNMIIHVVPDDQKTVVARLTVLLRQGLPIPYSLLRTQLSEEVTEDQVFSALSVCAVMVRGNFCLHSRFVSLPRELQRARTFMLSLLQYKGMIRRQALEKVYQHDSRVSSDKLHVLLKLIAKRVPQGWILRIEDDDTLISSHPKQVALHQKYWERVMASRKQQELLEKYQNAMDATQD